jgi:hypothetical protein
MRHVSERSYRSGSVELPKTVGSWDAGDHWSARTSLFRHGDHNVEFTATAVAATHPTRLANPTTDDREAERHVSDEDAIQAEWKPGRLHWRIATGVAVFSVIVAAISTATAVHVASKPQAVPTLTATAVVNLPPIEGNPGVADPKQVNSLCSDERGQTLSGWGPDRPMFVSGHSNSYSSLNSVRDSADIGGDERAFYGARISGTQEGWSRTIQMKPGKTYRIRVYVHNNSTTPANNVKLVVNLPTCTGRSIGTFASLDSDAYPMRIWAGVNFQSDSLFNLAYVHGSAILEGPSFPNGQTKVDSEDFLWEKGALIGSKRLDGVIAGGYENVTYFSFEVRPQFAQ